MGRFPIGVIVDSFRVSIPEAVKKAAEVGANGIQVYATSGAMSPENLIGAKRSEFKSLVSDNGLVISALCGDLGGGFGNAELNPSKIEKSKRILDLAKELGTDVVTTHIGVVPSSPDHDRYKVMLDACHELAEYADSLNAHFAIETGPEKSDVLKAFLDNLNSTGVAVNLDPANLVMVAGDNPVDAVYNLRKYIVHTHAKDGRMNYPKDPEIVYGVKEALVVDNDIDRGPAFEELPLGQGKVPFKEYLDALYDIGYKGFLTIERECGDCPEKDIRTAVDFLKNLG